jgi:hypothetical protein
MMAARSDVNRTRRKGIMGWCLSYCGWSIKPMSSLYVARFDRDFDFVVTGVLDRKQYASVGFVGKLPQ